MRKQRAFASLTEAEINQVADWLGPGTYATVLERVKKPRPEGFGLDISRKPLETLHESKNKVAQINERIKGDTKLTVGQFYEILGGEPIELSDEVHEAILETTRDLALHGDNTPADLLALQRLADFPARAEYRAHRVALDLRKEAQKAEMDTHRKQMNEERLALAKRSFDLREKQFALKSDSSLATHNSSLEDDLGPYATDYEGIRARTRAKFGTNGNSQPADADTTEPETLEIPADPQWPGSSRGNEAQILDATPYDLEPSPVLRVGEGGSNSPSFPSLASVDSSSVSLTPSLQRGEDITPAAPDPSSLSRRRREESQISSPAFIGQEDPLLAQMESPQSVAQENSNPRPSASNKDSVPPSSESSSKSLSNSPSSAPSSLEHRVNQYTLDRYQEAIHGKDPRKVGKFAALKFKSKMQWCPCGQQLPCPDHGDFPPRFFEICPDDFDYFNCLRLKNLPYTSPYLLMNQQKTTAEPSSDGRIASPLARQT